MALALKMDLTEGHSVKKTSAGWEIDRIAIVTGMEGAGDARIINASAVTGFPAIGDAHPTATGSTLKEINAIEVTPAEVKFKLAYRPPGSGTNTFTDDSIEVGASITQTETNKDKAAAEIYTSYEYPIGYQRSPHDVALTAAKPSGNIGAKVPKFLPQNTYVVQKVEGSSPKSKAMAYVGKINSSSWEGYAAKTLMCTAIMGRSNDGGDNYNVTYRFQYNPNTWAQEVLFIKDDGKPPYPTDSNSKKTYDIYDEVNFTSIYS